jgi:hypothetical protein
VRSNPLGHRSCLDHQAATRSALQALMPLTHSPSPLLAAEPVEWWAANYSDRILDLGKVDDKQHRMAVKARAACASVCDKSPY